MICSFRNFNKIILSIESSYSKISIEEDQSLLTQINFKSLGLQKASVLWFEYLLCRNALVYLVTYSYQSLRRSSWLVA